MMFDLGDTRHSIEIDRMGCLRAAYYYNECSLCQEICPVDAISLGNNRRMALDARQCIECSACVGVCPSEAISTAQFDQNLFILRFAAKKDEYLSCKSNTPCLSVFHADHFISMGLRKESVICDLSSCAECSINIDGKVEADIRRRANEASRLLDAIGMEGRITLETAPPPQLERRAIFGKFVQGVNELQEDVDITEVFRKEHPIPTYRQLLQNSFKRTIETMETTAIHQSFSFTANKQIDFYKCTNCGDCVQFCPTKALTYSVDNSRILFQNLHCIACGICDDICKPKAFSDKEELDMVTLAFNRAVVAIEHHFVVCSECKTSFPQKENETICTRCIDFVERSKDLFALAKDL